MTVKHGLGRGLKGLMEDVSTLDEGGTKGGSVRQVPLTRIARSSLQPRQNFAPDAMEELVRSVRERGVVQPLLVRKKGEGYELIAGERRFRAATEAGLANVPVIELEASDQDALELALIENLLREGLNVIEEAEGYKALTEKFDMTQDQIAQRVGKARASVANAMRLLDLSDMIKGYLRDGKLSAGHAKVLLAIEIAGERQLFAERVVREGLSVRSLEKLVERRNKAPRKRRARDDDFPSSQADYVTDLLRRKLGTSVRVTPSGTLSDGRKTRGSVEIDFFSVEDLNRILDILGLTENESR